MIGNEFSPIVLEALKTAGWFEGREALEQVMSWKEEILSSFGIECFSAAEQVLLEFGGLRVGSKEPGIECSCNILEFNPMLAAEDYSGWERAIGRRMYPLGEVDDGHALLTIDDNGEIYLDFGDLFHMGTNIAEALTRAVEGRTCPRLDLKWEE